jgi:hypothetical protein
MGSSAHTSRLRKFTYKLIGPVPFDNGDRRSRRESEHLPARHFCCAHDRWITGNCGTNYFVIGHGRLQNDSSTTIAGANQSSSASN